MNSSDCEIRTPHLLPWMRSKASAVTENLDLCIGESRFRFTSVMGGFAGHGRTSWKPQQMIPKSSRAVTGDSIVAVESYFCGVFHLCGAAA